MSVPKPPGGLDVNMATAPELIQAYCEAVCDALMEKERPEYCEEERDEAIGEWIQEELCEFRESGIRTNLPSPSCRHYESYIAAREIWGRWVAWVYWFGGGKHGEPEAEDWIEDAFFVTATPKRVTVMDFARPDATKGGVR